MRKTLFLSDVKKTNHPDYKFECPYIFFNRKWHEDTWYFNSLNGIKEAAKKQRFLIK